VASVAGYVNEPSTAFHCRGGWELAAMQVRSASWSLYFRLLLFALARYGTSGTSSNNFAISPRL
jgi:hypothetical protein